MLFFDYNGPAMATHYVTTHMASVGSTQDEAWERFEGSPVLVTAERQTSGRGRSGSEWLAAPRAMTASLAMAPGWPESAWPRLTLVAGLSARSAIGEAARLKWPNDVMSSGKKVGGILSEARPDGVVVGLGVNMWWPDAPRGMGALCDHDPGAEATARLADRWAAELIRRVEAGPEQWGHTEYVRACETVGQLVTWEGGSGMAIDVDEDGALVVDSDDAVVRVVAGEVRRLRTAGQATH